MELEKYGAKTHHSIYVIVVKILDVIISFKTLKLISARIYDSFTIKFVRKGIKNHNYIYSVHLEELDGIF